jgi:hypothetical protein
MVFEGIHRESKLTEYVKKIRKGEEIEQVIIENNNSSFDILN